MQEDREEEEKEEKKKSEWLSRRIRDNGSSRDESRAHLIFSATLQVLITSTAFYCE